MISLTGAGLVNAGGNCLSPVLEVNCLAGITRIGN
jgi:hypothetical protein